MNKEYDDYLQSEKWRLIKDAVLRRDGFKCCRCDRKDNLQVHHKTYKRIFNERLTDLETLCKGCHYLHHYPKKVEVKKQKVKRIKLRKYNSAGKSMYLQNKNKIAKAIKKYGKIKIIYRP